MDETKNNRHEMNLKRNCTDTVCVFVHRITCHEGLVDLTGLKLEI